MQVTRRANHRCDRQCHVVFSGVRAVAGILPIALWPAGLGVFHALAVYFMRVSIYPQHCAQQLHRCTIVAAGTGNIRACRSGRALGQLCTFNRIGSFCHCRVAAFILVSAMAPRVYGCGRPRHISLRHIRSCPACGRCGLPRTPNGPTCFPGRQNQGAYGALEGMLIQVGGTATPGL